MGRLRSLCEACGAAVSVASVFNPRSDPRKRGGRGAAPPRMTQREAMASDDLNRGRVPFYRSRWGTVYLCSRCGERCDGPAMWCPTHLAAVELRP